MSLIFIVVIIGFLANVSSATTLPDQYSPALNNNNIGDDIITMLDENLTSFYYGMEFVISSSGFPMLFVAEYWTIEIYNCLDLSCSRFETTNVSNVFPCISIDGAVNFDGLPIIAANGGGLLVIKCEVDNCAQYTRIEVESTISLISIQINKEGLPVITYFSADWILKLAQCLDVGCTDIKVISVANFSSYFAAVQIFSIFGLDGNLIFVYYSAITANLNFMNCFDAQCSSYNKTVIGPANSYLFELTLSGDGNPVFGCQVVYHCNDPLCYSFSTSPFSISDGSFVSVGKNGYPIIASPDTTSTVQFFYCLDFACQKYGVTNVQTKNYESIIATVITGSDNLPIMAIVEGLRTSSLFALHCGDYKCTN